MHYNYFDSCNGRSLGHGGVLGTGLAVRCHLTAYCLLCGHTAIIAVRVELAPAIAPFRAEENFAACLSLAFGSLYICTYIANPLVP